MEDQRARFVSRATLSPSSSGGASGSRTGDRRSQWHGMDLHTNAPTSHRRAMYYGLQPKPQQSPLPRQMQPAATVVPCGVGDASAAPSGGGSRADADDAALTARNLMLRHRLAERKRYDSADEAMRRAMQALHSPGPVTAEASAPALVAAASASPRTSGGVNTSAMQSPRVSARLGASVFASALKSGHDEDVEMQDDGDNNNQKDADPMGYIPANAKTPRYGQLGISPSAAMSAANYLIHKKLHEKRHFDSADYQLALQGKQTDAAFDGMGAPALSPNALQLNQAPSPIKLNRDLVAASPVNSPSASRAASMRLAQMSPSVQRSTGTVKDGRPNPYGALGGGGAMSKNDLRRNVLLRQQETFISRQDPPAAPSKLSVAPQDAAAGSSRASKFGKLCAANVLLRRDLKERKYFDSADYEMECAAKQAPKQGRHGESPEDTGSNSPEFTEPSNQSSELNSPDMHPQVKHMKMANGAPNKWANHPQVAAAQEARAKANLQAQQLASKNVALTRLSERHQHFDSGDHFAAAAASHRRREAARGRLAS